MTYLNGKKIALRDSVIGRDKAGRPIGGHVLEVTAEGQLLISPPVQSSVWARASECLPLDVIDECGAATAKQEAKPEPWKDGFPPTGGEADPTLPESVEEKPAQTNTPPIPPDA